MATKSTCRLRVQDVFVELTAQELQVLLAASPILASLCELRVHRLGSDDEDELVPLLSVTGRALHQLAALAQAAAQEDVSHGRSPLEGASAHAGQARASLDLDHLHLTGLVEIAAAANYLGMGSVLKYVCVELSQRARTIPECDGVGALQQLCELPADVASRVVDALVADDDSVEPLGVFVVGRLSLSAGGCTPARRKLEELAYNGPRHARCATAEALRTAAVGGDVKAVELLERMAREDATPVGRTAVEYLGRLACGGDQHAIVALQRLPSECIQFGLEALARAAEGEHCAAILGQLVQERNAGVRRKAIMAMRRAAAGMHRQAVDLLCDASIGGGKMQQQSPPSFGAFVEASLCAQRQRQAWAQAGDAESAASVAAESTEPQPYVAQEEELIDALQVANSEAMATSVGLDDESVVSMTLVGCRRSTNSACSATARASCHMDNFSASGSADDVHGGPVGATKSPSTGSRIMTAMQLLEESDGEEIFCGPLSEPGESGMAEFRAFEMLGISRSSQSVLQLSVSSFPKKGSPPRRSEPLIAPEGQINKENAKYCCVFPIGLDDDTEFHLVKRIFGKNGDNMRRIAQECSAKLRLRGRGSGFFEKGLRDVRRGMRIGSSEADIPLELHVSCTDYDNYYRAVNQVAMLLNGLYRHYRRYARSKQMEVPDVNLKLVEIRRDDLFKNHRLGRIVLACGRRQHFERVRNSIHARTNPLEKCFRHCEGVDAQGEQRLSERDNGYSADDRWLGDELTRKAAALSTPRSLPVSTALAGAAFAAIAAVAPRNTSECKDRFQ